MNYAAIAAAMQAEIDDSKECYMPNSPGAFVRDRLFRDCMWEEAAWAWGCFCRDSFGVVELDRLRLELKQLAANEKMPEWGTRGT